MIIINTPHNPVGKVFTRNELERIAALAQEFNLLVMSDEVVSADTTWSTWYLFCLSYVTSIRTSMTVSYSMAKNTYASQHSPVCGTGPFPCIPQGVSPPENLTH